MGDESTTLTLEPPFSIKLSSGIEYVGYRGTTVSGGPGWTPTPLLRGGLGGGGGAAEEPFGRVGGVVLGPVG
jgi:hypothetical protein